MPRRLPGGKGGWFAGLLGLVLASCAPVPEAGVVDTAWVSTADRSRLLAPFPLGATDSLAVDVLVAVDTLRPRQPIEGFGAALTDAAQLVLDRLPTATRTALIGELFSPTEGIGLSMLRVPLGASDFSPVHDTFDDVAAGVLDTAFTQFRFERERGRVALLRDIRRVQPALQLIATPWSAPAWMKTPARLAGGTLRDDALGWYAAYLVRVLQAYDSAGVRFDYLSAQNEPQHEPPDYPGMRLTAAQRSMLIGRHLGPQLAARFPGLRLLEWDHNWDAPEEPLAVLQDTTARRFVHGVAWHCYAGQVSAQSVVQRAHPGVATYFTECAGGDWAPDFGDNLLWNVRTLLIGATRHWARGVLLWSLALDTEHGPHLGGCRDCRGIVTVDSVTGTVTRNAEYYALAHASRFVPRGAVRHDTRLVHGDSTTFTQVAFRYTRAAAKASLVVIAANGATLPQRVRLTGGTRPVTFTMPARSVATIVLR